jgi:hypothetical protein
MNAKTIFPALLVVAVLTCPASATQSVEIVDLEAAGKEKTPPLEKDKLPPDKKFPEKKPLDTSLFNQDAFMGNQFPTGFNPQMMGDFGILFVRQTFTIVGVQTRTTTTSIIQGFMGSPPKPNPPIVTVLTTTIPVTQTRTLLVPFASSAAAFKVAENESPRPTDRVFGIYNYFGGIHGVNNGASVTSASSTPSTTTDKLTQDVTTVKTDSLSVFPSPSVSARLHRELFGFEKTFLDGRASVEFRLPFLQANSNLEGFGGQHLGDLTIVTKYAFLLDNETGNIASGGFAITTPTGPSVPTFDGALHSTLLQPWFGYIRNFDAFYIQGFHSIVVPTDPRDVTMLFTDIGVNYWLYRGAPNQFLNSIVPLAEVHVTTPLNHRNTDGPIFVPDQVVFTGGVHFGLGRNTTLSFGVATPVTGPRPFNVEAFGQLNWRY